MPAGLATVGGNLGLHGLQFFGLAPHQHHMGTQPRQFVRRAAANARTAARDHDDLPGKQPGRKYGLVHQASPVNNPRACAVSPSSDSEPWGENH